MMSRDDFETLLKRLVDVAYQAGGDDRRSQRDKYADEIHNADKALLATLDSLTAAVAEAKLSGEKS